MTTKKTLHNEKTGIVIQCHDKSTRLPHKLFKEINNTTVLERVISNCCKSKQADVVIIAVTTDPANTNLINYITNLQKKYNIMLFKYHGDDNDVLSRYYRCAEEHKLDRIVRITSDCCLIIPDLIDLCIKLHKYYNVDVFDSLDVDGLDIQCITFNALKRLHTLARNPYDKEHVFTAVYANPDKFSKKSLHEIKLSVDGETDLQLLRAIFS